MKELILSNLFVVGLPLASQASTIVNVCATNANGTSIMRKPALMTLV
jgi:hypothetical protein